ncbi:hypothetical protein SASPL_142984 [Salvia splendens]|uniref:G-patch domain-containing protein n=1 Tax=Salvia splendens TaxID=180675 RepID=A0A8X8Z9Y8_SALSN|nr:hypothetical protein SASPL_142984 [Salvia splendens]
MAVDHDSSAGLGTYLGTSASTPIDSSNIGFQFFPYMNCSVISVVKEARMERRKWPWCFRTGVSNQQGRLEPIATTIKKNKRGLGAEQPKKPIKQLKDKDCPESPKIKTRGVSKKMRKIQEFEKKMQEKEFDQDFFRMFWPDNV